MRNTSSIVINQELGPVMLPSKLPCSAALLACPYLTDAAAP